MTKYIRKDYKQFIQDHKDWIRNEREDKPMGKHYNLQEANFEGANLCEADFEGASLQRANLRGANLKWANLEGGSLREANFEGANLRGARIDLSRLDIIALTNPLFNLMKEYNKKELIKLAKELLNE